MIRVAGEAGQQYDALKNGRFLYDGGFINQPLYSYTEAVLLSRVDGLKRITDQWEVKGKPQYSDLDEWQIELLTLVENGN